MKMMGDDPPFLAVGTEVSAKYKGAFCEAKIRKVVKTVKCKVLFKQGLGIASVPDELIKGNIRVGAVVEAKHPDRKEFLEATITKIQDCSQYTVVFDDGDITTLRRTALCLKSGRHFAESETLDQLPLTHPEHFSNPVIGGRRGRRHRTGVGESSDDEDMIPSKCFKEEKEADIGRVVCVEGEKKKQKDNWFPALVVAPTAQDTVRIHVREEYLVRSFKDGRYYTVPKKETAEFTREVGAKVDNHTLKAAVEKALLFLDKDELPPHWDRDLLFGLNSSSAVESDHNIDSDSSDDEPREEKDHFVAQLYKFMDDRGTPINQGPTVCSKDVDLYRLFKVVNNHGGYNRVSNYNHWKTVSSKLGFGETPVNINLVKHVYKRFLHSFEEFYRKLGCTMINHPRTYRNRNRAGRSLIRDKDRLSVSSIKMEPKSSEELEEPNIQEASYTMDVLEIKTENDEITYGEFVPFPKSKSTEPKEKCSSKKTVEVQTKVKEEKKEDTVKVKVEPVKEIKKDKSRVRQSKLKNVQGEQAKNLEIKDPIVEKKKRLYTRTPSKKDKEVTKQTTGLAITRQKRIVKDKVKSLIDKFKLKIKDSPVVATDPIEKTVPSVKPKLKEENILANSSIKSKKEDLISPVPSVEEKKKGGRKKRDKKDPDEFDTLPTYKSVCVGDKLKVYYGPTHESKVTYEAKVLSIRTEGSETMYLVHYTGWNNRYDEYIKHSRIADNLSWVPGRATKKQNLQSLFKTGRRKNSSGKIDANNPKLGSSAQNKGKTLAVTRASSRMSTKRDDPHSENETEDDNESMIPSLYMCDEILNDKSRNEKVKEILGIHDFPKNDGKEAVDASNPEKRKTTKRKGGEDATSIFDSKSKNVDNDNLNSTSLEFGKSKDKVTNSEQIENVPESILTRRRSSTNDEKIDSTSTPPQGSDSPASSDEKKRSRKRSLSLYPEADSPTHTRKRKSADRKHFDLEFKINDSTVGEGQVSSEKEDSTTSQRFKIVDTDASKGRDFDLNQIRSELKGLEKAVKVPESDIFMDKNSFVSNKGENDTLTEDIYEFKEPEPFEFEVRKSIEEKTKSQRRPLGRMFEEIGGSHTKKHSNVLLSNIFYKGKKESQTEQKKELLESIYNFDTCEERFDKICSSPLRPTSEEGSSKHFQLFSDLPEEEGETETDVTENTRNSDSASYNVNENDFFDNHGTLVTECSSSPQDTVTRSPPLIESVNENSNFDSNEVESTSKSCFSRDDEDELGDESINYAIQRAIKQDISDDSNPDIIPCPSPNAVHMNSSLFINKELNAADKSPNEPSNINIPLEETEKNDEFLEKDDNDEELIENDKCLVSIKPVIVEVPPPSVDCPVSKSNDYSSEVASCPSPPLPPVPIVGDNKETNCITTLTTTVPPLISPCIYSFSMLPNPITVPSNKSLTDASFVEFSTSSPVEEKQTEVKYETDCKTTQKSPIIPELVKIETPSTFVDPDSEKISLPSNEQVQVEGFSNLDNNEEKVEKNFVDNEPVKSPISNAVSIKSIIKDKENAKLNDKGDLKQNEINLVSLLCEETIPGSPSSHTECVEQLEEEKSSLSTQRDKTDKSTEDDGSEERNTGTEEAIGATEESSLISPDSPMSSHSDSSRIEVSGSPPTVENDSSKSQLQREFETEIDTFVEAKEFDEDSRLDSPEKSDFKKNSTKRGKHSRKQSIDSKKFNRSRQNGSDSDTSENSVNTCSLINSNNSNAAMMNISNCNTSGIADCSKGDCQNSTRSKICKYNFLIAFEPDVDPNVKITVLQNNIQQIRKLYADMKSELAVIDRRRKKLRKRERENLANARLH